MGLHLRAQVEAGGEGSGQWEPWSLPPLGLPGTWSSVPGTRPVAACFLVLAKQFGITRTRSRGSVARAVASPAPGLTSITDRERVPHTPKRVLGVL